ncbi:MAG: TlpA family protein disulfide reductase [Deltaproteobacteria bacterium]|nr:TlpA family protein disulfide reductase [Deltaproteobacteria bacterium]
MPPKADLPEVSQAHLDNPGLGNQAKIWFAIIFVLALVSVAWPRGDGTTTAPGGFLLDSNGRPTTLGNHLTPVTLLHFWATWCPPCITEIPALDRLAADYIGKPGFQIAMVAVADDIEKVRPFVGNQRAFSVLYDPEWQVAHRYGTRLVPETYVIVRGRTIDQLKFVGNTNWDDPQIRAILDQIISRTAAGEELDEILAVVNDMPRPKINA